MTHRLTRSRRALSNGFCMARQSQAIGAPGCGLWCRGASVKEKDLLADCKLRRVKYLNNVIEQDLLEAA